MVDKCRFERGADRHKFLYRHRVLCSPRVYATEGLFNHAAREFAQRHSAGTGREDEKTPFIELLAPERIAQSGIEEYRVQHDRSPSSSTRLPEHESQQRTSPCHCKREGITAALNCFSATSSERQAHAAARHFHAGTKCLRNSSTRTRSYSSL